MNKEPAENAEEVRAASGLLIRELNMITGYYKAEGFTHTECRILTELKERGILTVQEIAGVLNADKSNTSRTLAALIKKSLIAIAKDGTDSRRKPLKLTVKGLEAVERINKKADRYISLAMDMLSEGDRKAVINGIEAYAGALRKTRLQAQYVVRLIRKADNGRMAEIIQQVMAEYGATGAGYSIMDNEVLNMYEAYSSPGAVYYVIEKEGMVYGGAGIGPLKGGSRDTCELKKMYFLNEIRGIGFGDRLIELCVREAKQKGYKQCYLETLGRMPEARSLYEKHGFKQLTKPMGDTGHFKCEAWYAKQL